MSATPQTVPAFGRSVIDARRRGESVNLKIYAGFRCWDLARGKEHCIAVPTPGDAGAIDWRPIAGGLPGITLITRGWQFEDIEKLARALVLAGAKMVSAISMETEGGLIKWDRFVRVVQP